MGKNVFVRLFATVPHTANHVCLGLDSDLFRTVADFRVGSASDLSAASKNFCCASNNGSLGKKVCS